MKSPRDIKNSIKTLNIAADAETHDRVVADLLKLMEESRKTEPVSIGPNISRAIAKSKIIKLAAAVVVAASLIGLTYWLPSGEKQQAITEKEAIEIPAELAAMPVEELLEIHFGRRESAFGSELVRAAAERALSGLSARQIIALTTRAVLPTGKANARVRSALIRPLPGPPDPMLISGTVAAADLIVQARVDRIEIDADDARAAILEKRGKWMEMWEGEVFVARIKGTVQLDVRVSYPASAAEVGEPLVVDAVFCTTQRAGRVEQGKEYLVALKQQGETMSMLANHGYIYTRQEGVYIVDSNSETVSGSIYGPMPLDETWAFIMDAYDAIHEGMLPSREMLDYWLAKLQSNDLLDCWTAVDYLGTLVRYCWLPKLQKYELLDGLAAVEYLSISVQPPVDPQAVGEAIERQVGMLAKYIPSHAGPAWREFRAEKKRRGGFVEDALDLLINLGDPSTNERIVELYKRERWLDGSIFSKQGVGNYDTITYKIRSLVPSMNPEAEGSLRRLLSRMKDPPKSPEAEKPLRAMLMVMKDPLTGNDSEFISFLAEILVRHPQVPRLIGAQMPEPSLVPVLTKAIENDYSGDLAWALYACGREEEAVEIACGNVRDYLNDPNTEELSWARHYSMWRTIRLLGTSDSKAPSDLLEVLTYPDVFMGPWGNRLQAAAIMALARAAAERATEQLRELYAATDDYYVRIATAVSLRYLGDDGGHDLLEHFINHTERSVPEIEKHWGMSWGNLDTSRGRPFHEALLYLRSPQTEELFLERLRNGVREVDMRALAIARAREREVLPILVEHLNSGNGVTRDAANGVTRDAAHEMLKRLTSQDFGYGYAPSWGYPLGDEQIEAVERWSAYVVEYLAERN
ncbi:MAG: hypothetical protein ISS79_03815 [Phycisphaerae bacterium]|nr:hypothetical protein [Phycisphaerae bacterium]